MSPDQDDQDCAPGAELPVNARLPRRPLELGDRDRRADAERCDAQNPAERLWTRVLRAIHGLPVLVVALAALALPRGAGAQLAPAGGHIGWTRCVLGHPHTDIDPLLDSLASLAADRHERVHRAQLAGDCDAVVQRWAADPTARLEAEAEAVCAELEVLAPRRPARARQWVRLVDRLEHSLPNQADQVAGALARWCGP